MAELDVLGLLDDFAQVFDINYYLSKRERILGYGMAHKKGHSFWTDLYVELKRQKKMSYRIRAWWVYYTLRHFIARSMKPIANGYKRKVHNKYAGTSKHYADLYIRL